MNLSELKTKMIYTPITGHSVMGVYIIAGGFLQLVR